MSRLPPRWYNSARRDAAHGSVAGGAFAICWAGVSSAVRVAAWYRIRVRTAWWRCVRRSLAEILTVNGSGEQAGSNGPVKAPPTPTRYIVLVRHGQATFNIEGRHPGQLPGVPLTDEGRRQAHQAAIALAALPISAVISSPLERARGTAEIIARGWGIEVRAEPRLMDTDVGPWAGKTIDELAKHEPAWKAFLENPDEPPPGIESLSSVQARAMAVVEEVLADPSLGPYVVLVAHADVLKLILAHYLRIPVASIRYLNLGNASISALAYTGSEPPNVLAINWTMDPRWLVPPAAPAAEAPASALSSPATERATSQGASDEDQEPARP